MNLTLTPEFEKFVEDEVKAGRYATPQDVIVAGLSVLMQEHRLDRSSFDELESIFPNLRQQIAEGLQDANAGRFTDGEAFFDHLEREDQQDRKTA